MAPPAYDIRIDPGEGLSGRAFLTGKPSIYSRRDEAEVVMSTAHEAKLRRFEEATGGIRFPESALAAGLVYKGEPIGAFVVENLTMPGAFDAFDRDLVGAFAQAASIAIVNARLFESERQSRLKLETLNEEIRVQRDQLQHGSMSRESLSGLVKEGDLGAGHAHRRAHRRRSGHHGCTQPDPGGRTEAGRSDHSRAGVVWTQTCSARPWTGPARAVYASDRPTRRGTR